MGREPLFFHDAQPSKATPNLGLKKVQQGGKGQRQEYPDVSEREAGWVGKSYRALMLPPPHHKCHPVTVLLSLQVYKTRLGKCSLSLTKPLLDDP